jgi:hypothetical protein
VSVIATIESGFPVVHLVLTKTTIPARALPANLHLPVFAELLFKENSICINVKLRDEEMDPMESDDPTLPIYPLNLSKADVISVNVGGHWSAAGRWSSFPTIKVNIRDPYGIDEALYLMFASVDANNPNYWIEFLARAITEKIGVPGYEAEPIQDQNDIPF